MRYLLFMVLFLSAATLRAESASALGDETWYHPDAAGNPVIQLYFYWSKKCPHCLEAMPYIEDLSLQHPDLEVHSFQLVGEPDNVTRYQFMASALGEAARSVPAFFVCNTLLTGFDPEVTPGQLESLLNRCKAHVMATHSLAGFRGQQQEPIVLQLPFVGAIEAGVSSLPMITLLIAGVDAFNPCAFFVLMFLLTLMLHTHNRRRMLLVGGVFVFFSGALYFLFMTAWLNLFRVIGHLDAITIGAAVVALIIGLLNIKDFFWFKQGVSLTISEQDKPKLIQRMRNLLQARSLLTLLVATSGLALFANMYEFLCTAGFPMVYTRILTLSELSSAQYYAYLLLYNVVYVIPLLIIVAVFAVTMGAHRLQESEGRLLKLVSGNMILGLGLILLFAPGLLQNLLATVLLVLMTVVISVLIVYAQRVYLRRRPS